MFIVENECIYCGACVVECPESAIKADPAPPDENSKRKNVQYAIISDVCTECPDQDLPLCFSICPMNCIKIN